jgi:hypothetical protein
VFLWFSLASGRHTGTIYQCLCFAFLFTLFPAPYNLVFWRNKLLLMAGVPDNLVTKE